MQVFVVVDRDISIRVVEVIFIVADRIGQAEESEPSAAELRFVFRSGRLCLAFCATVGERGAVVSNG